MADHRNELDRFVRFAREEFVLAFNLVYVGSSKKNILKIAAVTLAFTLFALSGCSAFGANVTYVVIIGKSTTGSYWEALQEGARLQAAAEGTQIKYVAPASPDDIEGQLRLLEEAIEQRPSALAIAPIAPTAPGDLILKAKEAGIVVIAFESQLEAVLPTATVGTDNQSAGAEAARHMCNLIGEEGYLATVASTLGRQYEIDRFLGIRKGLENACPDATLLDPITLDNDPAAGVAAFNQLLAEQKPVGVFFTTREAAATILETYQPGEERPVLIGFDAGQAQVEAIRSGVMTGAVAQNPTGIGSILVSVATQWANGKTTSKHVDTGYFWYDNSSIDKENVKAVIDDS